MNDEEPPASVPSWTWFFVVDLTTKWNGTQKNFVKFYRDDVDAVLDDEGGEIDFDPAARLHLDGVDAGEPICVSAVAGGIIGRQNHAAGARHVHAPPAAFHEF